MDENNNNIVQEILHDLFSSLEALETQNTAILQFLKDKGIATDEELASQLEQAGKASSVRWRGVRVRADYLFASAIKAAEQAAERESPKPSETAQESKPATKQTDKKETAKSAQQVATNNKPANDHPESDQAGNDQPKNDQAQNDKPESGEASARVEQKAEQNVEQNVEQNIEQDVKQDRNQPVDENNRPSKNTKEKAA
jgi:phage repressor protein C with HTH and peptisase S24 domain